MRWLADEGTPRYILDWLRELGQDVLEVADSPHRGQTDAFLWQLAGRESRVVVTRDLGFLWPGLVPWPAGVVVIRVPDSWQAHAINLVFQNAIQQTELESLAGNITVLTPGRVRQRPIGALRHEGR